MDSPTIILTMPVPPSANRLWRNTRWMKRPVLSPEYREWKVMAGWECKQQLVGVPTIIGRFVAHLQVPIKSRRDLDNWAKPILDMAESSGAIRNDRGCIHLTVNPEPRHDVCLMLWDRGGEMPEPRKRKPPTTFKARVKATADQVAKFRKAGGLA